MLVLLMAAIRLEFRAWNAQLFDLGQIGFHAGLPIVCPPVDLLSCFNESSDLLFFNQVANAKLCVCVVSVVCCRQFDKAKAKHTTD